MNRLRIVVEETGPDAYEVKYVGTDFAKADAALREPTAKDRALYNKPQPTQYNRPIVATPDKSPKSSGSPSVAVPEAAPKVREVVSVAPSDVGSLTETLSTELPDKSKSKNKSK